MPGTLSPLFDAVIADCHHWVAATLRTLPRVVFPVSRLTLIVEACCCNAVAAVLGCGPTAAGECTTTNGGIGKPTIHIDAFIGSVAIIG